MMEGQKTRTQRAHKVAFPCPICDKPCGKRTILCETGCGLWVHQLCVPMSESDFVDISGSADYFLCPKCITSDTYYDYEKCLQRIISVPTPEMSKSEKRLLALYNAEPVVVDAQSALFGLEDSVSVDILRRFHGVLLNSYSPRSVVGDGNCLYRAASLALFGTEDKHVYLRVITALEIVAHRETYTATSPFVHPDLIDTPVSPSSYEKLLYDATTLGAYSEMGHIYALSAALGIVILSYMPQPGAIEVKNPYYKTVIGRDVRNNGAPRFSLMWTMMSSPVLDTDLHPNHFVYLSRKCTVPVPVDLNSSNSSLRRVNASLLN